MTGRRLVAVALLVTLAGCTPDPTGPDPEPRPSTSGGSVAPLPTAAPAPPAPAEGACYRLRYADAVSPTSGSDPVACRRTHTSQTYHVGTLDRVVDGRLLAVDADQVQQQPARECPRRLARFVGGSNEQRRLSMVRPVWFTPSLAASDAGAGWFRCDALALAGEERLLGMTGSLAGVLDTEAGRRRLGICGTAEPGTRGFRRVVCDQRHAWRAIRTVPLAGRDYPGSDAAKAAGEEPCRAAARARAADPLDFRWGYEWPTARQWEDGRTWGLCWIPD